MAPECRPVDDPMMRGPHGCEPERWLSNAEVQVLIERAEALT
jgi:hypothetical protein